MTQRAPPTAYRPGTVGELWVRTRRRLDSAGIPDSRTEAEVLLRHALTLDRPEFFARLGEPLPAGAAAHAERALRRRLDREPLAYIVGRREFYGLDLLVDARVLIPRQETELLVELTLEHAGATRGAALTVADIGTGCGCIAAAIAVNNAAATVYATDASRQALAVADVNLRAHGVRARVHLKEGDLLEPLPGPVDVIVSNPPYIPTGELAGLAPELRWEPASALDGGATGLAVIERLLRQAPAYLRPGGRMFIEASPDLIEPASRLARESFPAAAVGPARELSGVPRVVKIAVAQQASSLGRALRDQGRRGTPPEGAEPPHHHAMSRPVRMVECPYS